MIEEEPGEDPGDLGYIAVCWRDNSDNAESISVCDDERITILRRAMTRWFQCCATVPHLHQRPVVKSSAGR